MARAQVWTWGEPWGDFSMHVDRAPKRVQGAADIVKIACGAFHNLALNACALDLPARLAAQHATAAFGVPSRNAGVCARAHC